MKEICRSPTLLVCAGLCILWSGSSGAVAAESPVQEQLRQLRQQNEQLQRQLQQQQTLIEDLSRKVSGLENAGPKAAASAAKETEETQHELSPPAGSSSMFGLSKVNLSGEGGLGFFQSQAEGQFPKAQFRVDEARLFVEAPVWNDVYFWSEITLAIRESNNLGVRAGDLYLDFEGVS